MANGKSLASYTIEEGVTNYNVTTFKSLFEGKINRFLLNCVFRILYEYTMLIINKWLLLLGIINSLKELKKLIFAVHFPEVVIQIAYAVYVQAPTCKKKSEGQTSVFLRPSIVDNQNTRTSSSSEGRNLQSQQIILSSITLNLTFMTA